MRTKHGTASQSHGSYVDFQAAVLRALPRDIDFDVALGWMQDRGALARVLREALMPDGKPAGNTYPLSVDYGRNVDDGVKAGHYDSADPDITSRNFPTEQKGAVDIEVKLIHFGRLISDDDARRELDKMGMRPAELQELLTLGEKYPGVQHGFPVVALGSVRQGLYGRRYVPCLCERGPGRLLHLIWAELAWQKLYRFAAVRR